MGFGTVGSGVFAVLQRNQEEIARRAGCGIEVAMVSRRDVEKARAVVGDEWLQVESWADSAPYWGRPWQQECAPASWTAQA